MANTDDKRLFNIDLFELTPDVLRLLKDSEVTSSSIKASRSQEFEDDGLYSSRIFGPQGSTDRNMRYGYIDFKIPVLHPVVFEAYSRLKLMYRGIMEGKIYAKFDNKIKDFEIVLPHEGQTGYSFFVENMEKIKFTDRNSEARAYKIKLVEKYGKQANMYTKWLVIPAGLRDYTEENGVPKDNEINDYYRKLISAANLVRGMNLSPSNMKALDKTRYKIQIILLELYDYLFTLLDGKNKFIQGKWAKRAIANSSRNVITPTPNNITDLNMKNKITLNHTTVGLYQYIKGIAPITANKVMATFSRRIFTENTNQAILVNPKTLLSEEVNVNPKKKEDWMTYEGIVESMNKLKQDEMRSAPIMVDGYYLRLVHDDGKNVTVLNHTNEIGPDMKKEHLRPLTYPELFYIAIYDVRDKYPAFITRYPVGSMGGVYPTKLYLKTTANGRTVNVNVNGLTREMIEYPKMNEDYVQSLSPHDGHIKPLQADFDGDVVSLNMLYTEESIKEIDDFLKKKEAYLTTSGSLAYSASTLIIDLVLTHMTDQPKGSKEEAIVPEITEVMEAELTTEETKEPKHDDVQALYILLKSKLRDNTIVPANTTLYSSLDEAVLSLDRFQCDSIVHVYKVEGLDNTKITKTSPSSRPWVKYTNEYKNTEPMVIRLVGSISTGSIIETLPYYDDEGEHALYRMEYKVIVDEGI